MDPTHEYAPKDFTTKLLSFVLNNETRLRDHRNFNIGHTPQEILHEFCKEQGRDWAECAVLLRQLTEQGLLESKWQDLGNGNIYYDWVGLGIEGRRRFGTWPESSADHLVEVLLSAIDQVISQTDDPEELSKWQTMKENLAPMSHAGNLATLAAKAQPFINDMISSIA